MESIATPFHHCVEKVLENVKLDEYFVSFYEWAASVSMPIVVLSGGLTPLISATLSKLVGPSAERIEVVANEVITRSAFQSTDDKGGWSVQFRDDSKHGNDKAATIRPYAQHRNEVSDGIKSILMYAGDGVSDLSAARETDLLFAKDKQGGFLPVDPSSRACHVLVVEQLLIRSRDQTL